ncbi:MAG: toll/interleukin-1 receptor domain-containing protein [Pseudomonadota bacterium]
MTDNRKVFISYSHDSEQHKAWVLGLAEHLLQNGVDVVLDQWNLDFGDDLPAFMERAIRDIDRVLVICTDSYNQKANSGKGGVGYEKTIITAEMLQNSDNRRKFIPIVRGVSSSTKLPTFFGAALYLDLSDGNDTHENRTALLESIYQVNAIKPKIGSSPFLVDSASPAAGDEEEQDPPSLEGGTASGEFNDRFSVAFPGLRGTAWIDDPDTIQKRLNVLLRSPLRYQEGMVAWWWRGPQNLQIESFRHVEGSNYLVGPEELNVSRIAAVNPNIVDRKWVYVETRADKPTGLYDSSEEAISRSVDVFGYCDEEYGLVDGALPVTRAEYDDGAAIIDDEPVDITGRAKLRVRFITPYNFIIAPFQSPINNTSFDSRLRDYLNGLLRGDDVFNEMAGEIGTLPLRADR